MGTSCETVNAEVSSTYQVHLQMGKCSALQRGAVLEDELNPLRFGDLERFHLNNLGGVKKYIMQ